MILLARWSPKECTALLDVPTNYSICVTGSELANKLAKLYLKLVDRDNENEITR